ncbi:MAG: suppressor of fused domain protein [Erysipelotrichaceae bacterium]
MDINKIVAQHELKILGGTPKVNRYLNDIKDKSIDILICMDVPQKGIQSCASIGLNNTDIGLHIGEQKLRVEILGACDKQINEFGNIIASVAFNIMDSNKCYPGYIVEDIINQYIPESHMKHVLLTDPFLWKKEKNISVENLCISLLMIVPISDEEFDYVKKKGVDALEKQFEEKEIDIYNIYRKSII